MKNRKKIDQLKFEKEKVFCVNLKSHNDGQISAICDRYSLSYDSLTYLKSEGMSKIWIEEGSEYLIAYTTLKEPDYINICENYVDFADNIATTRFLREIKQIGTPKIRKQKSAQKADVAEIAKSLPVVLETDAILEKIFKYGIASISKEEKQFLDSQS